MEFQRPKISPRAYMLALKNDIDILSITPTGPEGRIIERDVLRVLEREYLAEDEPAPEVKAEEPVTEESAAEESVTEEPAAEESVTEEPAAEEPAAEEPAAEEPAAEESVTEESVTEESAAEEPAAEESVTEESAAEEPAAEEQKAIVAAPVTAVAADEKTEKEESKEEKTEKSEKTHNTDAYRHTDVIIPGTEKSPDKTPMTIGMSFDASAIVKLRTKIKENCEAMGLPQITLNDMILFACAKTLKKNKALNAHFLGDKIRYFDGVHLGLVVDTGHGVETPTVFDADRLSLSSLAKITGALVRGARAGNISPEKNQVCASFMVLNLGTLGVEAFTPSLIEPQTGILGVSALQNRIKEENGEMVSYPCIPLSLTFDPRAMNTASAAKFLHDLCAALESFELLLIK